MKIKYNGIEYEAIVNEHGHVVHESEAEKIFFGFSEEKIIIGEIIPEVIPEVEEIG